MLLPASSFLIDCTAPAILHPEQSVFYSRSAGQCADGYPVYSAERLPNAVPLSQFTTLKMSLCRLVFNAILPISAKDLQVNFIPSQLRTLLASSTAPANKCSRNDGKPKLWTASHRSSRFYPPDGYPLSPAGTSTLLRNHLSPHTASESLESPLVLSPAV